jgi:hypothetical protein
VIQALRSFMAESIVHRFVGTYWNNATLNARCVPDGDMEDLLAEQRVPADGKDMMLFVNGIKPGTCTTEVREIFNEFTLRDVVNIPPGGKAFCFISLCQDAANALLGQFGRGVNVGGRVVSVSVSDDEKKVRGLVLEVRWQRLRAPQLCGRRISRSIICRIARMISRCAVCSRTLVFEGGSQDGYAFIGVASSEAEETVQAVD